MAEPKVGGAVEEMNKIAGLGLTQTNMAEDNAHPTKKPVPKVAEMIETDSHHLISGSLGGALRRMGSNRRSERRKPLSSKRPIFRESCHMQETEAIAEAVATQANESRSQTSPKKQMIRHSVATQTRLAIFNCLGWKQHSSKRRQKTRNLARFAISI